MEKSPLGYIVVMFDVMGFEFRLRKFGLPEIHNRYTNIIDFVRQNTKRSKLLSESLNITGPFWLADGGVTNLYEINVINSSDSILIWSNLGWKMIQNQTKEELKKNESHPAYGHLSKPIPLLEIWNTCAELICRSIEFDLPIRGAVSTGDAVFDIENRIFLGEPIVDTARLENKQHAIGLSLCKSFVAHEDISHFFIPYSKHYKPEYNSEKIDLAFNWPHYWKNSRPDINLIDTLQKMSDNNDKHSYYANTIEFVKYSESLEKSNSLS